MKPETTAENQATRTVLENGTVVVSEHCPYSRTVSTGIWTAFGSRYESETEQGSAHFIEHMLFKGAAGMSPMDIALAFESVGGNFNAAASRESTHIYAKMLAEHLPLAIKLLSDMAVRSAFPEEEFAREKEVVLEEIKSHEDNPEDVAYDYFLHELYGSGGMGHGILGSEETIVATSRDDLYALYKKIYKPSDLIVSVAGYIKEFDIPALVEAAFKDAESAGEFHYDKVKSTPDFSNRINIEKRDYQQTHFFAAFPGVSYNSADRFTYAMIDMILSGGMSSRLFQEVREKRGLVYDISSESSCYKDSGYFSIYACTRPGNVEEVIAVTSEELKKIKNGEVSKEELARVKEQLRASMIMSLENVNSRMAKLARCEMYYGRYLTDDEILASIEKIGLEDIERVTNEIFKPETTVFAGLGPFNGEIEKIELEIVDVFKNL